MITFEGKIVYDNGYPVMCFGAEKYTKEELRDILFGMYNFLVKVDFMQIFSTGQLPRNGRKNKKIKAMGE